MLSLNMDDWLLISQKNQKEIRLHTIVNITKTNANEIPLRHVLLQANTVLIILKKSNKGVILLRHVLASASKYRADHPEEIRERRDPVAARASDSKYRANHPAARSAEARREERRREYARFQPIRQQWDIDHPCKDCGKIWLKSSEAGLRKKCCQNGLLWDLFS